MKKPKRRPRSDYWDDEPFRPDLTVYEPEAGLKESPAFIRFKKDEPKPRRRVKQRVKRK
jgi:hypothetical protein